MARCISIITNFGCHYKCPYCIVKRNHLSIPVTTIEGLDTLESDIKKYGCTAISVSGGGDPLFQFERHRDWYKALFSIANRVALPVEMHTSYLTDETPFPFFKCGRVVYHLNTYEQLSHICRTGEELVRVVYVVTEDFTTELVEKITGYVESSGDIDELSFRQLVGEDYQEQHYLEGYLKDGHGKKWHYIEQKDYNLYYAENRVYHRFRDFQK